MANVTQTRHDRVKEILDRAAGDSAADYEGLGRFWKVPLDQFLELKVCGVRMIAAAGAATRSCCSAQSPTGDTAAEQRPRYRGRAAASGLIQGLRGQSPFDGSRFPRLPWGGATVDEEDIQFIADWIDDGCPANDHEIESYELKLSTETVSFEDMVAVEDIAKPTKVEAVVRESYEVYEGSPNQYKFQRGELKQRMNIDCMTPGQIDNLRYALRELYNLNKWPEDRRNYNNLALIHQNHCQHGWERFLPWHRIYMYEFEQALQDCCPDVTMPYWDWTMPRYCPSHPEKGSIIPWAFKCFLTKESLKFLQNAHPKLPVKEAKKLLPIVVDGAHGEYFATLNCFFKKVTSLLGTEDYSKGEHRERFIDALLATNSLWYPLRYPSEYQTQSGESSTINNVIHYHYPTADDIEQILSLNNFRDFGGGSLYNDSFGFLDQNPHNTMHIWTGGMNPDFEQKKAGKDFERDLDSDRNRGVEVSGRHFHTRKDLYSQPRFGDMFSNLTASYDPVFWPVHSNVDRLWWEWQQAHPHATPADLDSVLTPWSYTIADTLDMYRFGYEYVKCTFIIPVGLKAPVGRFVSKSIDIPEPVRGAFRHAEVRLHRVPQLPRSCFIRVFLNRSDANASTPITEDNNYAGYLAIFGHGPCYGGPGHCDLPPARQRQYDLRPRSHNTPRNHRVNVTNCAKRLLQNGASTLQITLVVIGADYQEDNELLRLDGVSLNFLD